MKLGDVEGVAQGRVWTGVQARDVGLVDDVGGVEKALAYAVETYGTEGDAHVEVWPKRLSVMDWVRDWIMVGGMGSAAAVGAGREQISASDVVKLVMNSGNGNVSTTPMDIVSLAQKKRNPGVMLTMDEDSAINFALNNSFQEYAETMTTENQ